LERILYIFWKKKEKKIGKNFIFSVIRKKYILLNKIWKEKWKKFCMVFGKKTGKSGGKNFELVKVKRI